MLLINLIAAIANSFSHRHREQAYVDLMVLDDHLLADIGLRRSDIVAGCLASVAVLDGVQAPTTAPRPRAAAVPEYFPAF
jgi:uncharacterized protein YjiS (DUF1127 family)